MARINLLPWREELRKQKQNDFLALVGASVLVTMVLAVFVYFAFSQLIAVQKNRNGFLEAEIKVVEKRIEEIKALESEREQLISRMQAIEALQTTRPLNVRMFDELATRNPEGVSFNKMSQASNALTIEGVSQSNARVSSLMRNLDASQWLSGPQLQVIEVKDEDDTRRSHYMIGIKQSEPKVEDGKQQK
ncbi:MAG: PilN domain-containing protein [Candidatus Porifericomitaceae bacterium WSBS_2022_MAG_OTU9]